MKKLTRKNLDELAKVMPSLNKELQQSYMGGYIPSCVFNAYDYLDGDIYNANHYYEQTSGNLGYVPTSSGGVNTSDIPTIGSYGGFDVREIPAGSGVTTSGYTTNGERIMMTYNSGGIDHAVVVTSVSKDSSGNAVYHYYDPTNKKYGTVYNNQYSALYSVGYIYTDSPVSGSYDSSGSYA